MVAIPQIDNKTFDANARAYLLALKSGNKPAERPDCGPFWTPTVAEAERIYTKAGGNVEGMARFFEAQERKEPALADLLYQPLQGAMELPRGMPALPDALHFSGKLVDAASSWLNNYVAFSKKWSPRGYDGYHEAVGMSLLSTVAAHRVSFPFGQMEYTPLYTAMVGFTTLFKKTTTARLYYGVLEAAKLDWLLGADITTPQRLLSDMAGNKVPDGYETLAPDVQKRVEMRLAMSGQRGWYYDEFGMHLDQMVKDAGPMGDFKGLLRILDDCKPVFENATQQRGLERIEHPYLSLLASLTPSDIQPYANKNHKFWRDGLFARFSFVCPPMGTKSSRTRFPKERLLYPASLIDPLKNWHNWLGMPEIEIEALKNKAGDAITGYCINQVKPLPERECISTTEVDDALEAYEFALLDMVEAQQIPEALFGSYGRLHKLALRVAMLLASLENRGVIELRHWAKGQAYAEARRRDLHELFEQVNLPLATESAKRSMEDEIMKHLERHGALSLSALHGSYLKNKSVEEVEKGLRGLERVKRIRKFDTSWTTKYEVAEIEEEETSRT